LHLEGFAWRATDQWATWTRTHARRIASSLLFVGDAEFNWDRLVHRQYDWSVLGIGYHARGVAVKALKRGGHPPLLETKLRRGLGLMKRLGLLLKEKPTIQRMLNIDFQRRLEMSRYSYTCGSGYRFAIRKFLEIPAAGAVMVCQPFTGFEATGFRDGENAIACEPEAVMDAHRMLQADPDRAQAIADAGRELVFRKHSVAARAAQFREALSAMADQSFAGARWEGGEYVVRREPAVVR
jgi:hypothetical protein